MQIHDLNTKALTDPAYVAFDDGTDTYKANFKAEIDNAAADAVADADLTDNTVAFTSGDAASPTAWTAVSVLTSGLTIKALFNRISTMIKNVRWLYSKLGTTDISSIGGGTVTGAISSLNSNLGVCIRHKQGAITIPDGTSSRQYVDISLSDITVPSGYSLWYASVVLGNYQLPYVNTGGKHTGVSEVSNVRVRIFNDATAWNDFTYYMVLFYIK